MAAPNSTPSLHEEYPNLCAANFVTVKLSGRDNYNVWQTQMICLLETHALLAFIYGTPSKDNSLWRRSDALVRGWILGSLSEQAANYVVDRLTVNNLDFTAKKVWDELQTVYGPVLHDPNQQDQKEEIISREAEPRIEPEDEAEKQEISKMEKIRLKLHQATLRGSLDDVTYILSKNVRVTDKINDITGNTALHVAVGTTKNKEFVEKMLELAPPSTLFRYVLNSDGSTLLHVAAIVGNTQAAEILVQKDPNLLLAKDKEGHTPLAKALSNMHTDTYLYLLDFTETDKDMFVAINDDELLVNAISSKNFYSAMRLVDRYRTMNSDAALMALAQNYPGDLTKWEQIIHEVQQTDISTLAFLPEIAVVGLIKTLLWIGVTSEVWPLTSLEERSKSCELAHDMLGRLCRLVRDSNDIRSYLYYTNPILEAARLNAYKMVQVIVYRFPNAIWSVNKDGHNIIQVAVINCSEQVYNLLYQMSEHRNTYRTIKDSSGNNLLHLAGRLAPTDKLALISGAALQIQHELQWFKEVEGFVCPLNKIQKNAFGETPQMVFTREHKELLMEGEKWMKDAAQSYTITTTLITTMMFAAAITVPGGNKEKSGLPYFSNTAAFTIFAISDAISLLTSVTSLLMFLSILTGRFAEQDFVFKLPTKLVIGLAALFVSTTTMILAFGATLFLVFGESKRWTLGPIATLTCLPIASFFISLQLPLIAELISATYGRSMFGRKRDTPFY